MGRWIKVLCALWWLLLLSNPVYATTVSVYAESGLIPANNQMLVKVYADITNTATGGPLVSAGFKLTYGAPLSNPVATKNDNDWYFGTPQSKYTYIDPYVETNGEVVFLLGKLDQNAPQEGVTGQRVLLGTILFDYAGSTPTAANLGLSDGHEGNFVDFATVDGTDLDSNITFSISQVTSNNSLLLQDAVRSLQVTGGVTPSQPVRATNGDIDADGKIGIGEAINLIQQAKP